jgi:hypothetical protein
VAGIRHFRFLLEGRRFSVLMDHKPLTYTFGAMDGQASKAFVVLAYIAEFTGDIRHVSGIDNIVADTLSRPAVAAPGAADKGSTEAKAPSGSSVSPANARPFSVASVPAPEAVLDYRLIAAHQISCADTIKTLSSSSLVVQPVKFGDISLLFDVSQETARPVILTQDRKTVFLAVHSLAHQGTRVTRQMLSSQVVWRGMASDIAAWCRDCQNCCRAKVTAQPSAPIQPIPVPACRFSHVHVDIVGPLPAAAGGFQYILTVINRTTR